MLLHGITIHLFLPTGIDSPGLVEENKQKPALTVALEEGDKPLSPESCAASLFKGESSFASVYRPVLEVASKSGEGGEEAGGGRNLISDPPRRPKPGSDGS